MPWHTPTLEEARQLVRDYISAKLPGADAAVPNSVMRVLSDSNAGLAHLTLRYLDWLADQIMIDKAESEWLDRFGTIWLGGRKPASFATGTILFTGVQGTVIPSNTRMQSSGGVQYETTQQITIGSVATPVPVIALDPGSLGNQVEGALVSPAIAITGADSQCVVVDISNGFEKETDDSLRDRILTRIRKPPHGGAAHDYVGWAREVDGVTRAWAKMEAGMGTVSLRFMMDEDRTDGLPLPNDVAAVAAYIDARRPVSVKDVFVIAPKPYFIKVAVRRLSRDNNAVRASIEANLRKVFLRKAEPGGTMHRSWIGGAVSSAAGEDHHELIYQTMDMPDVGYLPVLQSVVYPP